MTLKVEARGSKAEEASTSAVLMVTLLQVGFFILIQGFIAVTTTSIIFLTDQNCYC